jgi:hypothetical protein
MYRQHRLDGTEYVVRPDPPVPYRTDHEGYETWRHQYRADGGEKREETVRIHRLAAVAWFGFGAVADDGVVVHHRSGVPWDNRESNLELMDWVVHSNHHNPEGVDQRE